MSGVDDYAGGQLAAEAVAAAGRRVTIGTGDTAFALPVDVDVIEAGRTAPLAVVEVGEPAVVARTQAGRVTLRWPVVVKVAGQSFAQANRIAQHVSAEALAQLDERDGWRFRDVAFVSLDRNDYDGGPPQVVLVLNVSPVRAQLVPMYGPAGCDAWYFETIAPDMPPVDLAHPLLHVEPVPV